MLSTRLMFLCAVAVTIGGCGRTHYRLRADNDAYSLLTEKTWRAPWYPSLFTIDENPQSRLFDPSPKDDPCLPVPAPQLYAYALPEISPRDPARFQPPESGVVPTINADEGTAPEKSSERPEILRLPSGPWDDARDTIQLTSYEMDAPMSAAPTGSIALQPALPGPPQEPYLSPPDNSDTDTAELLPAPTDRVETEQGELEIVAIGQSIWESIPESCLRRMFEFESVLNEYEQSRDQTLETTGRQMPDPVLDSSERLALEDLVELGVLNSREYQSAKESLYQAALRLSLERYDYQLKFTPMGNGSRVNWSKPGGTAVSGLDISSSAAVEKVLATGGNFVASFANNVLLTFNGADGFTANVGSEIFAELTQRILQRDIVFERLTQAERNVVYAARDFARFRKIFFRDISRSYYDQILAYRDIEIATQDYFSNQRGFDQSLAQYRQGQLPRFQVDQFEQQALESRSSLIGSCNSLEQGFDELKLLIGIPPETPINLDLRELEQITARDKATAAAELVRRARQILETELQEPAPAPAALINGATKLASRVLELLQLQEQLGTESARVEQVQLLLNQLRVEESLLLVQENDRNLKMETEAERPQPLNILQRRIDLVRALLTLQRRRLVANGENPKNDAQLKSFGEEFDRLRDDLDTIQDQIDRIPEIVDNSRKLLEAVKEWIGLNELLDQQSTPQDLVDAILQQSQALNMGDMSGLSPIKIPVDDAMLTALVNRFELMNRRGELADAWRQIKLAGDDLRSILNLQATQLIRTRSDVNRVFDFTFDESETNLSLQFDAPLNRRAQRNTYRSTLIDYHVAMRTLMRDEDLVKFSVRNSLRDLQLIREQYAIAVASAALANERVQSTRLQLQLGLENITARDFLESQQAYTRSLLAVARLHINYIRERIDLFLELELLEVDESGFWPQLYQESYQPTPRFQPPACSGPAYGSLPPGVHYSKAIRRMDGVPFGSPMVFDSEDSEPERLKPQSELEELDGSN